MFDCLKPFGGGGEIFRATGPQVGQPITSANIRRDIIKHIKNSELLFNVPEARKVLSNLEKDPAAEPMGDWIDDYLQMGLKYGLIADANVMGLRAVWRKMPGFRPVGGRCRKHNLDALYSDDNDGIAALMSLSYSE